MSSPGERIDLPNGSAVYFVEENHSYWRCKPDGKRGQRLTGVTTAVAPLDFRPDGLMGWAAKLNGEGIAELAAPCLGGEPESIPDALAWLESGESIWQALTEAELTWEHIRERAATRGTTVHELALRALAMGRPVPDFEEMTEEEQGYAQGVVKFWLDHSPEPTHVEQIVADPDLGVAGRFDLRTSLQGYSGVGLVDAKTGESGFIPTKHHAQLALYDYLAERCGIGATDWQLILKLAPDGEYELIEAQATHEDALAAVDLYRRAGRINREAGKARKAARAVAA